MRLQGAIALVIVLASGINAFAQAIGDSVPCGDGVLACGNENACSNGDGGKTSQQDCCDETWTVRGSALWLSRNGHTGRISRLLGDDTPFGPTLPHEFGYDTGYEIELRLHLDCDHQLVARWFDANWRDAFSDWQGDAVGTFSHGSELQSFDIVRRSAWNDYFNPSLGIRYVEFGDSTVQRIDSLTDTNYVELDVDNSMVGLQIGADGGFGNSNWWTIHYLSNLAVFGNYAHATGQWDIGAGPALTPTIKSEVATFLAEIGLGARFQLTECFSLRGGYRCMWLEGISGTGDLVLSGLPYDALNQDTAFFHGADLGFELVW